MPNIIAAMDPNGIIGVDNKIPWHFSEDFKRFKRVTMGGVLIMGRRTYESLPPAKKTKTVLPGRIIVTMTRRIEEGTRVSSAGVVHVGSMRAALEAASHTAPDQVWFAGGAQVYREAIKRNHVREIDLTLVPEITQTSPDATTVYFPVDLLKHFELVSTEINPEDPRLTHRLYRCTRSQRLD